MQISKNILNRWGYRIECSSSRECLWFKELQCWDTVVALSNISWLLRPIQTIFPSRKRPAAPNAFSLTGRSRHWGDYCFWQTHCSFVNSSTWKTQVFRHKMTKSHMWPYQGLHLMGIKYICIYIKAVLFLPMNIWCCCCKQRGQDSLHFISKVECRNVNNAKQRATKLLLWF